MALLNFSGHGIFAASGTRLSTQESVVETRSIDCELKLDITSELIKGLKDGSNLVQTLATIQTERIWTFTMNIQDTDAAFLSLLFNEVWQTTTSFEEGADFFLATVPSASTYVITNSTYIVSGLVAADVQVTITQPGSWGEERSLEVIITGTPTADQVLLTAASGTLTFAAANASAPVKVAITKTLADVQTIGVEADPVTFDGATFKGLLTSTIGTGVKQKFAVVITGLTQSEGWSLSFGKTDPQSLVYTASVVGANRSPVLLAQYSE